MSYSTASTSFCGGDVIPEPKKDQKGKNDLQKWSFWAKLAKKYPGIVKSDPVK
jgi:hypothetical protein